MRIVWKTATEQLRSLENEVSQFENFIIFYRKGSDDQSKWSKEENV